MGRRIRCDELGMRLLEREQLVVEPVELGVGDLRLVEDVVAVEVMVDLPAQLVEALLHVLLRPRRH